MPLVRRPAGRSASGCGEAGAPFTPLLPYRGALGEESAFPQRSPPSLGGSFKHKDPPEINGRGYVVDTLEAVLWAF